MNDPVAVYASDVRFWGTHLVAMGCSNTFLGGLELNGEQASPQEAGAECGEDGSLGRLDSMGRIHRGKPSTKDKMLQMQTGFGRDVSTSTTASTSKLGMVLGDIKGVGQRYIVEEPEIDASWSSWSEQEPCKQSAPTRQTHERYKKAPVGCKLAMKRQVLQKFLQKVDQKPQRPERSLNMPKSI